MPQPNPPPPDWDSVSGSSTEFKNAQNDANAYGFDSVKLGIKNSSGAAQYLFLGKSATANHIAWYLRDTANGGNCIAAKIPQATFDIIKGGTLDTSSMKISYASHQYLLEARDDGSGKVIAYAVQMA